MGEIDKFTVRTAKSLNDLRWIMKEANDIGWRLRAKDAECLFSINFTKYFFIGELDGKRVSSIAFVKYSEHDVHLGLYVVSKEYRGMGIGYRTWKLAFEASSISEECNVGVFATLKMEATFIKRGFQRVWMSRRYEATVGNVEKALSVVTAPIGIATKSGCEVDIGQLAAYDRRVFGEDRQLLLSSWICASEITLVAFNNVNMETVGYIILRQTMAFEEGGYRITPLYADNVSIAQYLLKCAMEVCAGLQHTNKKVNIIVPVDGNPDCMEMIGAIPKVIPVVDVMLMSTKGSCSRIRSKIFGVTAYSY